MGGGILEKIFSSARGILDPFSPSLALLNPYERGILESGYLPEAERFILNDANVPGIFAIFAHCGPFPPPTPPLSTFAA